MCPNRCLFGHVFICVCFSLFNLNDLVQITAQHFTGINNNNNNEEILFPVGFLFPVDGSWQK